MPTLTYPGDVSHMIGEVKGPSHMRELLTATDAVYDPAAGKTAVTFAFGVRCCECGGLLKPEDPAEDAGSTDQRLGLRLKHPQDACP